ncbi:MAG: hypothetical protein MUC28_04155 [Planctomycetes bacterium]|nr:hypothetical protein [Planctomycetota bacterium]
MKLFALLSITMIVLTVLGTTAFIALGFMFFYATNAEEYSPLDFSDNYNKFEVTVGYDEVNGRYATYHYEFSE